MNKLKFYFLILILIFLKKDGCLGFPNRNPIFMAPLRSPSISPLETDRGLLQ